MSKELLCDFKNRLIEKHGYGEDFAQDLAIMTESLEEYYGPEYGKIIKDTVFDTIYVKAGRKKGSSLYETIDDVLTRKGLNAKNLLKEKRPIGPVGLSYPTITYDGTSFHIDKTERVVALPHYFDANNPDSMAGLSRETMRLINGTLRGFAIDEGSLVVSRGLAEETSKLTLNPDGTVNIKPIEAKRTALEEGLLKYDELKFTREYYDPSYDSSQEPVTRLIAGFLSDGLELESVLREARMTKDLEALQDVLSSQMGVDLDEFGKRMEVIQDFEKIRISSLDDTEKFNKLNDAIDTYFKNEIVPIVHGMQESMAKQTQDGYQTGL